MASLNFLNMKLFWYQSLLYNIYTIFLTILESNSKCIILFHLQLGRIPSPTTMATPTGHAPSLARQLLFTGEMVSVLARQQLSLERTAEMAALRLEK